MVKPLVEQLESLDRDFKYRRAGLEEGCVEIAAGGSTLRYVLPRLPPRNLSTWQVVQEAFKRQNLDCQVAMEAGGWDVIKKYVELGLGISIISSVGITGQDKVEVIPASQFFPKRVYGVVMRRNNALSPQAMRFVELLLHGKGNDADPAQQG
ncbi:MAG TPA: LysR substrate-binding domain-containing protein [Verrucomicrobiae bacterium]|nr:LysR substrate-binding domain-containing protein [Verrucomicrobiae bacterium]